ncbi:MAG: hypothetical protein MZV63_63665 [Marinilabiliales bacterium]|nr:hypothetical protein [Marinilabiliales bacterium]
MPPSSGWWTGSTDDPRKGDGLGGVDEEGRPPEGIQDPVGRTGHAGRRDVGSLVPRHRRHECRKGGYRHRSSGWRGSSDGHGIEENPGERDRVWNCGQHFRKRSMTMREHDVKRIVAELTAEPGWGSFDDNSPDLLYCEEGPKGKHAYSGWRTRSIGR